MSSGSFQMFGGAVSNSVIVLGLGLALMMVSPVVGHKGSIVDVTGFGARPNDPLTDNSQAFIRAWNAACKGSGSSVLLIPPGNYVSGEVFFQGPCRGPVTINVQGTIQAVPDLSMYPNGAWFNIESVNGLVLKGGVFNGQGKSVRKYDDCKTNPKCDPLPAAFRFNKARNVNVQGVTVVNSMGPAASTTASSNIRAINSVGFDLLH
ncbi:hypothetical protein SAY87_015934 [Trapa incisa]|uniref:Polygalacturonase n=1 Tax=Trapa incisa TaxID=236973 RepID=A0AAN7LBJ6_9MYRT|nr:hypothetical protein SAY87_015934 [Trapa incisa]